MDEQPSRTKRQAAIADLISRGLVTSQSQLRQMLAKEGVYITQPTLSKDLADIGAIRVRGPQGGLVYSLASTQSTAGVSLDKVVADLLISVTSAQNLVIVHTPSGAAQYFALGLDKAGWSEVLGTVAGDDTVLVIAPTSAQADNIVEALRSLTHK
ncbi:MAG: arginine repressor [Propionibacteriaceae bacterium]|jgi:transcriptional regulator of arginine metabolism|nr:arginine repressor [Propionibacteriaceae bacterium]